MRGMPVKTRRVLLAKPRGYCAGVDRAVQTVEIALDLYGAPVYVRKQIVHNSHVVKSLEARGAVFVEEADEVPEGAVVVFSAHGVAPQVREDARKRGLRTIDATCPLVTKVHNEARRFAAQGYDILLIGHEGHEEVVGTTGEAPEHIHLVDGPDEGTAAKVRDPAKVAWLSQTTLSVDETQQTVAALRERFPLLVDPPSDDICYATQNRQVAVKAIASESELVLVVGSRNSSNSVRLVEVALDGGADAAYLVEDASALRPEWLEGVSTVGLTSGASVPEDLVNGMLARLAESGFDHVEEVEAVPEPSSRRRSWMHRGSPRAQAMITVRTMPTASHGAVPASVTTLPSTTDRNKPPDPVIAFTSTTATRNSSGGLTTTVSRFAGEAYRAASTQPTTKASPASTPQPSQAAASRPIRKHPAMVRTAPRPVSRAAGPAACSGVVLGGRAIGVCRKKFSR